MAGEIQVQASIKATKGTFEIPKYGSTTHSIDQSVGAGGVPGIMEATNAANGVNITTTGVATLGWVYLRNLDTVATVDFGVVVAGTLHVVGTMKAGEPALFRAKPGITMAVKSSVASSKVQALVLND